VPHCFDKYRTGNDCELTKKENTQKERRKKKRKEGKHKKENMETKKLLCLFLSAVHS
jgi:hypothetical protein